MATAKNLESSDNVTTGTTQTQVDSSQFDDVRMQRVQPAGFTEPTEQTRNSWKIKTGVPAVDDVLDSIIVPPQY